MSQYSMLKILIMLEKIISKKLDSIEKKLYMVLELLNNTNLNCLKNFLKNIPKIFKNHLRFLYLKYFAQISYNYFICY